MRLWVRQQSDSHASDILSRYHSGTGIPKIRQGEGALRNNRWGSKGEQIVCEETRPNVDNANIGPIQGALDQSMLASSRTGREDICPSLREINDGLQATVLCDGSKAYGSFQQTL